MSDPIPHAPLRRHAAASRRRPPRFVTGLAALPAALLLASLTPAALAADDRVDADDAVAIHATLDVALQDTLPTARRDTLEQRIRRLEARIDSLVRVIEGLTGPEEEEAEDELARLREAARAAAGEREPRDTTTTGQSRTRALQALNPEISVTGDFVGNFVSPDGGDSNVSFAPREFEISFQSALDPYTRTKIFLTRHEDFQIAGIEAHGHEEGEEGHEGEEDHEGEEGEGGEHAEEEGGHGSGVTLEEAYLYWVGLPGGIGVKAGQIRQEIGLYNRWHTHALLEVDRPLATTTFLGESLIQAGVGVTLPSFQIGAGTQTLHTEITRGDNGALFEGGDEISYLGRIQSFWDLGPASFFQVGATGVYGENDGEGLVSKLAQIDLFYRWTPPSQSLYRDLQIKSEWYFGSKERPGSALDASGGYVQANFRANRRWVLGARADFVSPYGDEEDIVQIVPSVSWWQSEWVRLRLQYNYLERDGGGGNHTLLFQTVWAIGPHKHEHY